MSVTLKAYADAGLTAEITVRDIIGGSSVSIDRVIYLGSTVAGKRFLASSNPGVHQITLGIVDSATGTGLAAASMALALTLAGLDTATPGAPINLGTQLLSGPGNSLAVHIRFNAGAVADGTYTELSLATNTVIEVDV